MKTVTTVKDLRAFLRPLRDRRIGLVPTMGYLHEGHVSLIRKAREECDVVVLSVFVNPLQFGPGEDYERYPRDLERDAKIAEQAGVDFLFAPSVEEMYPQTPLTKVTVSRLTDRLCGASRPGHFDGVATVVTKLFHIVEPDRAYFGMKDAQQVAVVEQMVRDLHFPVTVVPCPTVREKDGLAVSSRNVYLSEEERKQATVLSAGLREVAEKVKRGEMTRASQAIEYLKRRISSKPLARIDYVDVLAYPELTPVEELKGRRVIVAVAVRFGSTRLIDNTILDEKEETPCSAR
ncbi:pantoate--beta-alanine ligase [Planifilum fulgidum]|jgi:pantoate--beta-alanine ligase|uniref:Pantothenate synthetase n=1 Tax=Planifilum fulgidum TaxID=201973 RepID=A0A1I2L9P8_9BACL|nr:pantoate--beta-alanine ligase [Planifilum fulgidum]MBO2496460.1 pantoate--beta-alanine ligase [Bacillota bacterium]MBO2531543.1 pantoate--beta-alanine ligase [Thermoactinomycetaceae bacterium]SFF76092.1 pantoate--beta-alanine ligase [Planifilum fulgidum]